MERCANVPRVHSDQAEPVSEPTAAKGWRTNVCCGTPVPPRLASLPGCQASSAELEWRCWGSDSGSAWLRTRPYSARILRPLSLHLPSAPSLELADLNSHSCHSKGGDLFACPSKGREQQRQHASLGYLDNTNNNRRHQQRPPRPTTNVPHEPNLSRLESSTVDPGLARPSFSESGIQSRAAANDLGPHSAFLASWRANLRVNPEKPRAVPRPAAGTERVSIGASRSRSRHLPL